MDMNKQIARNALGALVIVVFLGGGYWYYLRSHQGTQSIPTVGFPVVATSTQSFQLPTSTPHVNGPTSPSPSGTVVPKPVTASGIRGSVILGPTCPVQRIPPDPRCADKPYATTLVAKNTSGSVVKTFSSDVSGAFKVSLPAGIYSVGPAQQAYLPRASFQDVIVKTGVFTDITIQFDSGIR